MVDYNGYSFNSGDNILFRIKGSGFIKGKIHCTSNVKFYLCSDDPNLNGETSPTKYGYKYSWVITLVNGVVSILNERDLFILPHSKGFESNKIRLNSRLIEFLYIHFKQFIPLFYLKLKTLERFNFVNGIEDGYVELIGDKNGKNFSVKIKLGRLIRTLVNDFNELAAKNDSIILMGLLDSTIEDLHNKWKSFSSTVDVKILKGQDILDIAYNSKQYHKEGRLKSCMTDRHKELTLYRDNPNQINAVVFFINGSVVGRSILWKCLDGKWYHDRLYSSFDYVRPLMESKLREMGYKCLFLASEKYEVKVDKINHTYFPYLDSLKVLDIPNSILKNKN